MSEAFVKDHPLLAGAVRGAIVHGWNATIKSAQDLDEDIADRMTQEVMSLLEPILTATKVIVDQKLTEAEAKLIELSNRTARLEAGW